MSCRKSNHTHTQTLLSPVDFGLFHSSNNFLWERWHLHLWIWRCQRQRKYSQSNPMALHLRNFRFTQSSLPGRCRTQFDLNLWINLNDKKKAISREFFDIFIKKQSVIVRESSQITVRFFHIGAGTVEWYLYWLEKIAHCLWRRIASLHSSLFRPHTAELHCKFMIDTHFKPKRKIHSRSSITTRSGNDSEWIFSADSIYFCH